MEFKLLASLLPFSNLHGVTDYYSIIIGNGQDTKSFKNPPSSMLSKTAAVIFY